MALRKRPGKGKKHSESRSQGPGSRKLFAARRTEADENAGLSRPSPDSSPAPGDLWFTRCPGCDTVYRILPSQIRMGNGEAICQECQERFNVLESLANSPELATAHPGADAEPPRLGWLEACRKDLNQSPSGESKGEVLEGLPDWDLNGQQDFNPTTPAQRIAWLGGCLLLFFLLTAQFMARQGPRLIQNETLRPWMEAACEVLPCALPTFRAPERIQIVGHDLHPATEGGDGLEFVLVISNQSSLPQSFPAIKLVLSGHNAAPAAARVFQPGEYLPESSPMLMAVDQPQEIRLLLAKPRSEIEGYSLELL